MFKVLFSVWIRWWLRVPSRFCTSSQIRAADLLRSVQRLPR